MVANVYGTNQYVSIVRALEFAEPTWIGGEHLRHSTILHAPLGGYLFQTELGNSPTR